MRLRKPHWHSLSPFGLSEEGPRHFREMARVAWENRGELPFAWRILTRGVCDGCALGTAGLSDWTIEGTHLCMVRLELLRLNTMPALDPGKLADAGRLQALSSRQLRELGRLPGPHVRRRGEKGFRPIGWEEALDLAASRLASADPNRVAFYLTSRGIPNETYYAAQKAARFLGTNHVDNSARLCHAASTVAMKETLGYGAATAPYRDWLTSDLLVFFGSNTPNNQPVTAKYLHQAKKNGAEIAVVNPYREPGFERYWVPSVFESALFGTRLADHWFEVDTGGDLAFANGVFKALLELPGGVDEDFVRARTVGFEKAAGAVRALEWPELARASGSSQTRMRDFARLLVEKPKANFVWGMGLTQHAHGVDTIRALVNVALARGLPGGAGGLTPIRGHSGVQGGAEVGCVPGADAETLDRWTRVWGFAPPRSAGMTAVEQVEAAAEGRLDVFWIVGGNFVETLPDLARSRAALSRPGLLVHQDIVLSSDMLVEPSDAVLLLPTATRYEIPGGVTETSTERRIIFSPEIPGRRISGARPEWQVFCEVAARARPADAARIRFASTSEIREEIARAQSLSTRGSRPFRRRGINSSGAASISTPMGASRSPAERRASPPCLCLAAPSAAPASTSRPGAASSSTRWSSAKTDPLTGASRHDVLMSAEDARELSLAAGEAIRLVSDCGDFRGHVLIAPIKPGNLEVHWPEGMALIPGGTVDPESREPDYNALVRVEKVT